VTVSYSIIVNDEVCDFIKPSRGIWQGDPLSPCLFILCMDVLAQKLHLAASEIKSGIGIKVCRRA